MVDAATTSHFDALVGLVATTAGATGAEAGAELTGATACDVVVAGVAG